MNLTIDSGLVVSMRDGARLITDVIRPAVSTPVPAILHRTPYDRALQPVGMRAGGLRFAQAGYAVVIQDVRGCFDSDGDFEPFIHEADDGEDTITWLAQQPWCNGQIGMVGASYHGYTQLAAASRNPPALKAIAPIFAPSHPERDWIRQGGAFGAGLNVNVALYYAIDQAERAGAAEDRVVLEDLLERLGPVLRTGEWSRHPVLQRWAPYLLDWAGSGPLDQLSVSVRSINVPALHIGGWFDAFATGTVADYLEMRLNGPTKPARDGQHLLIGPWSHPNTTGTFDSWSFGPNGGYGEGDFHRLHRRWFDHWLRGEEAPAELGPRVRYFELGSNRWVEGPEWPPVNTRETTIWLGGASETGTLSFEPQRTSSAVRVASDPKNPVPTWGGRTLLPGGHAGWTAGPMDQRELEAHPGVASFRSPPLTNAITIAGEPVLSLVWSSRERDEVFCVRLVDIDHEGRALNIADGIGARGSSVSGARKAEEAIRIALGPTAASIAPGHRLGIDVALSSFPAVQVDNAAHGLIELGPRGSSVTLPILTTGDAAITPR